MNATLTTESLSAATADLLCWVRGHGFRYFKSYNHFRRKDKSGFSYITINSVTHDRVAYHLAFYMGVQITEVESWLLALMGDARKVSHYDRTIWNYTVNIGPTSPHWQYPVRGSWTLTSMGEFVDLGGQVSAFVRDLVLPFLDEHQDPLAVRRSMIETPGHVTNIWPYRQILAIDCLYSPAQTEMDIALLEGRYQNYAAGPRQQFQDFVSAVRTKSNFEPTVSPKGGPAAPLGNSDAGGGSRSVS